ncbi:MAG: two-component system chemotaxis sensor kinase CheA [Planctomycetota bacterium]|jgi:two-component system chemotaxis sensor kinase CheA
MTTDGNEDLIADYLGEAHDYLEQLNTILMELADLEDGWPDDRANDMFRSAHSLKGLSACFGFEATSTVTHHMESLLSKVREGALAPTQGIVRALFDSIDCLTNLTAEIAAGGQEGSAPQLLVDQLQQLCRGVDAVAPKEAAKKISAAGGGDTPPKAAGAMAQSDANETVRVRMDRLDLMVNLTGELVVARSRFQLVTQLMRPLQRLDEMGLAWREAQGSMDELRAMSQAQSQDMGRLPALVDRMSEQMQRFNSNWQDLHGVGRVLRDLDDVAYDLDSVVGGIHEAVLQLRMVPLDSVFRRLQRVARDTAETVGKAINFEVTGGDTQIDKRVADELINPLVHMLRNSIDHGFETAEERKASGKSERGCLSVKSFQRGSSVVIEIRDDGRGIDPVRMVKKVTELGLMTPEEANAMSPREAQRQIFAAGFSTAAEVTEVSGRGMGMDIVAATIKSLRGSIELESVVGVGTCFTIQLPPSMSILASLLIEVGDTMFALPLTEVREIIELTEDRLHSVQTKPVVIVRDQPMPFVLLPEAYRFAHGVLSGKQKSKPAHAIVFGYAGNEIVLGVDRLVGKEDLVIKPLCAELTSVPGLAGMAIRGDGKVTLILDPSGFADFAMSRQRSPRPDKRGRDNTASPDETASPDNTASPGVTASPDETVVDAVPAPV